jgi:cytochrome c5
MSANVHNTSPEENHEVAHTGPIKTPQQLLAAVFFSFVVPIFAIIGLVYYVTTQNVPAAGAIDSGQALAKRIQKVGSVEIRDANRPLKSGEEVYKAQCVACHAAGAAGAPKFGDVAAWAPRLKTGFEALWNSSLKGKGAMGAQGGGDFNDIEIGRAVVYLTNAAGGKFAEPAAPAAPAAGASAPAATATTGAAAVASPEAVAALAAAKTAPAAAAVPVAAGAGEALYKQACVVCHASGVAGAPKFGNKESWATRLPMGVDTLTATVVKGKGAMPPKGGSAASEGEIRAAVEYMVSAVK